jgi:trehalose 6-phosphate synthase/phosphatase
MIPKLLYAYAKSRQRLFLLDYDGTLVGFKGKPVEADPDEGVMRVLQDLSDNRNNTVVMISGRDKTTLERWFGHLNVALVAEHGGWVRDKGQTWQCTHPLGSEWKETIRPIMELYSDRTPGSALEEKTFSLVWHYRRADPELAHLRGEELRGALMNLTENLGLGVFEGSKLLEVKSSVVNKGHTAERWISKDNWDFLLAAGDDYTDEEMFTVLPDGAYSIKVGFGASKARFNVENVKQMRLLLVELSRA